MSVTVRTPKNIIAIAVTNWVEKRDANGGAVQIKLEHHPSGGKPPTKVQSWATPEGTECNRLTSEILETAQGHAGGGSGQSIQEEYHIVGLYEDSGVIGDRRFFIRCIAETDEDGALGAYTEGPTKAGILHQDMRHMEAMARIHVDGIDRNQTHAEVIIKRQAEENDALRKENEILRTKINDAEDRSLERKLKIFQANQAEERKNKIVDHAVPAIGQVVNAAIGAPLFPVNTDNEALLKIKGFVSGLTPKKMEIILSALDMQEAQLLMGIKEELLKEERAEFARKQAMSQERVNGVESDPQTVENLAKRSPEVNP